MKLVLACVSLAVEQGALGPPTGLESLLQVMTRQVFSDGGLRPQGCQWNAIKLVY
jgi:hypothetical protein